MFYSWGKRRRNLRCPVLPVLCRYHCCCFLVSCERKGSQQCWFVANNVTDTAYTFCHFPNLYPGMTKKKIVCFFYLFFHEYCNFRRANAFLCQKWWRISGLRRNSISWVIWFAKQLPIKVLLFVCDLHIYETPSHNIFSPNRQRTGEERGTKHIM